MRVWRDIGSSGQRYFTSRACGLDRYQALQPPTPACRAITLHLTRSVLPPLRCLMASLDVDQKFLAKFARETNNSNPFLSSWLYRVLGLSVILSKKLVRAKRLRKLDTTRDTKSLQLYHHIIWLAREGLVMVEQYIVPMVDAYVELKVLAYKLRASFYHIYVLFHNQPSINQTAIPSFSPDVNGKAADRNSIRASPNPLEGGPVRMPGSLPPGLAPVSIPKPSASFLLPAMNYIPTASSCFTAASRLSEDLLSGSHPIRLSVKTEYSAYLCDCLHDGDGSRKLAQQAIRDVYNASDGMDDEMFDDASALVQILGKMMTRGLPSSHTSSTPKMASPETPGARGTPRKDITPRKDQTSQNGATPKRGSPKMDSTSRLNSSVGTGETAIRAPPETPRRSPKRSPRSPR